MITTRAKRLTEEITFQSKIEAIRQATITLYCLFHYVMISLDAALELQISQLRYIGRNLTCFQIDIV